jgi:hypothetical protein
VTRVALGLLTAFVVAAPAAARTSFLAPAQATITSSGSLEPRVLEFEVLTRAPSWLNLDGAAHTITFANGRCTFTLEPGARDGCTAPFWEHAGTWRYRVGGISSPEGMLRVDPAGRRVSIAARRRGRKVVLFGHVRADAVGDFGSYLPAVARAVSIFARTNGRPFTRVGRAKTTAKGAWRFTVRPKRTTAYQARAWGEPRGGTVWRRASSRVIVVRVG